MVSGVKKPKLLPPVQVEHVNTKRRRAGKEPAKKSAKRPGPLITNRLETTRMISTNEDRPQRLESAQLIVEELHDETMIYDPARNKAFCLNQTAAYVWKHSDGKKTVAEIAEMMATEVSRPVSDQVVWYALDILAKDGLLAPSETLPTIPAGVTRRALMQKLGMGAVAAVPLVTVLMASPTKAHASHKHHRGHGNGGNGGNNGNGGNDGKWQQWQLP